MFHDFVIHLPVIGLIIPAAIWEAEANDLSLMILKEEPEQARRHANKEPAIPAPTIMFSTLNFFLMVDYFKF